MGKINFSRVILGGFLTGVVVNGCYFVVDGMVLKKEWEDALKALGKTMEANAFLFLAVGLSFMVAILTIWLYAAIRPRYGPGPKTALRAAFAVWTIGSLPYTVGVLALGLFPARIVLLDGAVGIVIVPLATLLGAWVYKED